MRPPTAGTILPLACALLAALTPAPAVATVDGLLARGIRPLLGFPSPFPLCGDERLITRNISFVYPDLIEELQTAARAAGRAPLEILADYGEQADSSPRALELCRWNKFRLLLQVSYFGIYQDLSTAEQVADQAFVATALALRARLFRSWSDLDRELLLAGERTGFHEWSLEAHAGEPLARFLERESKILPWMSGLARTFVVPPRHGRRDVDASAEATLQTWLRMRTPLSSIWPELALQEAQRPQVAAAMRCLRDRSAAMACDVNLYQIAAECSGGQGAELPLKLLGLFSAQEAFLLRDLGAWLQQNLPAQNRDRVLQVLRDGAEVYYRLPEIELRCGRSSLFPAGVAQPGGSAKSYHFYATALSSYKLRQVSFPREVAISAPTRTAANYKRWAFALGLVYNLVVGLPADAGSTGDVADVLALQSGGASFGAARCDRDRRAGHVAAPHVRARSAPLRRLPLTARYVEGWHWDPSEPGRLLVDLVEVDLPLPRRRVVPIDLPPEAHAELRSAGFALPRVIMTDDELLAVY